MDSDDGTGGDDVLNQDLDKKSRKLNKKSKEEITASKRARFGQAFEAFKQGVYPSVNSCALAFNVDRKTLGRMITSNRQYIGGGRKSVVFTAEEEAKLVNFVSQRLSFGCGLDFYQLCQVIQELATALCSSNPNREFPSTWEELFPPETFVRKFIIRNNLVMRRTMPLTLARAVLTVVDLKKWFDDLYKGFVSNPAFAECFKDARRIYNQDETPITSGNEHQRVLAERGQKGPAYNIGGSSREHTTASVLVGADGSVPAIRIVWSGKRFSQNERDLMENIPSDGVTGKFQFSKTVSGYVTRDTFLEILSDLDNFLTIKNNPRPVILVIDGYKGHLGLAIAEYCDQHGIQLVLLRANMTHVLQPLGMGLFLKIALFLIKLFRCQSFRSCQVSHPCADPPLALRQSWESSL